MPYVTCPHCGASCFSVARYSTQDACPVCGEELQAARSVARSQPERPGRFCQACGRELTPEDDVVQVLGRPAHASCAVYRPRRRSIGGPAADAQP